MVSQWSHRFNNHHPHSSLGYQAPNEYAKQWKKRTQSTPKSTGPNS
ncbi:hypothetical protein [Cutibacterium sp.]